MTKNKKFALIIMDGWGKGPNPDVDAIAQGNTPFYDYLLKDYPNSELKTYGEYVGLPDGQMGNSEVGHMNIGAGRIVYQDLVKINKAIESGELERNEVIKEMISYAKNNNKPVHLLGLLSDGGVHSHIKHLFGLIDIFNKQNIPVYIHAFMDGRDTDPHSGKDYIEELMNFIDGKNNVKIATISGRFYAMDRDKRWERIKEAYDAMVLGEGEEARNPMFAVNTSYRNGVTDEFIKPVVMHDGAGDPIGTIEDGDAVLFFNFRSDRPRELTYVLSQDNVTGFHMEKLNLYFATMTAYDDSFKDIHVVFSKDNLKNTIGEVYSKAGRSQVRIAETEKYAHVTFFFSGGKEEEFPGEKRILIPSPKVATYDLKPEMSAFEVTDAIVKEIDGNQPDLIVLNYANGDMVGHTGDFEAAKKAVEAVDKNLRRLVEKALQHDYMLIITADHGNADNLRNPDGTPNTAHSMNPVPFIFVTNENVNDFTIRDGKLSDIAPTILSLVDMEIPKEMTGDILVKKV